MKNLLQVPINKIDYEKYRFINIDCENLPIGRISTVVVYHLLNKDRLFLNKVPTYILFNNFDKINLKPSNKFWTHSQHYGNGKWVTHEQASIYPDRLIRKVVRRMLPKSKRYKYIRHIFTNEQKRQQFLQKEKLVS